MWGVIGEGRWGCNVRSASGVGGAKRTVPAGPDDPGAGITLLACGTAEQLADRREEAGTRQAPPRPLVASFAPLPVLLG